MFDNDKEQAKLIYILYLAGFLLGGLSTLVGLVLAYMGSGPAGRSEQGAVAANHFRWQIRTFWIALLYSLIGSLLLIVGIGFLVLLAVAVQVIVRCVKGLQALEKGQPIENVESWLI